MTVILDPDPAAGGSIAGLVEIDVTVQRVAPVNGAVYVVDGADVHVQRADGSAIAVKTNQAGTVAAALPLKSVNGRVSGWVEGGLLLRYRAVHPSLDPAVVWEYFTSGGGPPGPAGVQGPEGPPGGLVAPDRGTLHTSTRVLGTTYRPSTTRPVLVTATVTMQVPGLSRAIVYAHVSSATPASYAIARELLYVYGPDQIVAYRSITFLVPIGHYYMLEGVVVLGTPTIGIDRVLEQAL